MRVGVILTPDNAIDPELWRWCAPDVSLHVTRLPRSSLSSSDTEDSLFVARPELLAAATDTFVLIDPDVVVFACTSGSFVEGLAGESRVRSSIEHAGAASAVTTSGAVLSALRALGVKRVAVGTPYDETCSRLLVAFLEEAGLEIVALAFAPPRDGQKLGDYAEDDVETLAERTAHTDADVVFLSCTALPTRELLGSLTERYGVPVISSVQATMWAALAAKGAYVPHGPNDPLARLTPTTPTADERATTVDTGQH